MALGCFWMDEEEIGHHPTNWFVHSYLEGKHYNSAGRLLQGASFQTHNSHQALHSSLGLRGMMISLPSWFSVCFMLWRNNIWPL